MRQPPKSPKKQARKLAKPPRNKPPKKRGEVRSGFEFRVLKHLQNSGLSFEYESEKIPYIVPEKQHNYIPDFKVKTRTGKTLYIESKGVFSPEDRRKMLLVIEQHPEKDIRMLFMRNNKLRKGSKTSYTDWCDKHGIKHHVSINGSVPLEWLSE